MTGSDIYQRLIAPVDGNLMHEVWDGTPWIVDAFTGPIDNYGRFREIMDWCRCEFGDESWPIHGKPGDWHCGGATVHGWTWIGFATEEMMQKFIDRWPSPSGEENDFDNFSGSVIAGFSALGGCAD